MNIPMFTLILTAEKFSVRALETNSGGFLIESHVHLFAGDLGMQVVGICGLLLFDKCDGFNFCGLVGEGWLLASKFAEISLATGQLRSPQSGVSCPLCCFP